MDYPSREKAIRLLHDYNVPSDVIDHSLMVERIAVAIAKQVGADEKLISVAALLHDAGRYKYSIERGKPELHSWETGNLLRKLGYPELAEICEEHFGLTRDCLERLGVAPQLARDLVPKSLEAKIIFIADKLRPGITTLSEVLGRVINNPKYQRIYFDRCPGLKEKLKALITSVWNELVGIGMKPEMIWKINC